MIIAQVNATTWEHRSSDTGAVTVQAYLNYITTYIQSLALQMSHELQLEEKNWNEATSNTL